MAHTALGCTRTGAFIFFLFSHKSQKTFMSLRVYYVSEKIMKLGSNVARENLISLGTCFGSISDHILKQLIRSYCP